MSFFLDYLFRYKQAKEYWSQPVNHYGGSCPYTDEALVHKLLEIRRRCHYNDIDVLQQAAERLGWGQESVLDKARRMYR